MKISRKTWMEYVNRLSRTDKKAYEMIADYLTEHEIASDAGFDAFVEYMYAVVLKYSEGSSAIAAEAYDRLAQAQGKVAEAAVPAAPPTYRDVAKTAYGTRKSSMNPNSYAQASARLVKRTGLETMMNNASRDGAYWAWIPNGDTCPFCIMLASRGWERAPSNAKEGNYDIHLHANCDCTYAVRFSDNLDIEGYDPDALYDQYINAGDNQAERLNALRRAHYEQNKDFINAQKRAAYEKRRQLVLKEGTQSVNRRGQTIAIQQITDGKYGLFISENATLKKQGLANIEKAIDSSLERLGVPKGDKLPTIVVLDDKEMGTAYASYNFVDDTLFLRASMGNKQKTISYQKSYGFSDPNDPTSTVRHELIHWKDAKEYRDNISEITQENSGDYLQYRNEQSKIKLDEIGINSNNVHTISRYASDQYNLVNDFDEAYTEYRVLNRR